MRKDVFVQLMKYPEQWLQWGMLPDELLRVQMADDSPGSEQAAEHYRNGAFHFWLRTAPNKDILLTLARLSFLEPDQLMAQEWRKDLLAKAESADEEVLRLLQVQIVREEAAR